MKKLLFLGIITIFSISKSLANTQPSVRLTPFTGLDYLRLEVDEVFRESEKSTFKAIIKSKNDGTILWEGAVTPVESGNPHRKKLAFTIDGLNPVLWTPGNPYLYTVSLQQFNKAKPINRIEERVGFRSFERRGGNLFLNGKPIFLRGIAINPPGRGIPTELEKSRKFALDYVAYMKSINVNIIRIPNEESWYDVCDELGMMVFGGNYGSRVANAKNNFSKEANKVGEETDQGFPNDFNEGVDWYENEKLGEIAHHPSLMVYALTNETPFKGERAEKWEEFLDYAYNRLKKWDETRVYIANAGYGYGKTGDICDLHRYWGWYYASPFTFLNIRDNSKIIPFSKKVQPITFTECVGNYTGPDGRYNLTPDHKNPGSQLTWTGHERQDLQSALADSHQSFTLKTATELFRRLRVINPELSGVFPFTIMFYNWNGIEKFSDMNPKPVTDQVKRSYQPILLSWESWTPNVYSGSTINPIAHVINDANDFKDLENSKIVYQILDKTKSIRFTDTLSLPTIPYYGTHEVRIQIEIPEELGSDTYDLIGKIVKDSEVISENFHPLYIVDKALVESNKILNPVLLYDSEGSTKTAFKKLNIPFKEISSFNNIPITATLVIGENSANIAMSKQTTLIKNFVFKGGRLLCLRQSFELLPNLNKVLENKVQNISMNLDNPKYPPPARPSRNGYYVNPERPDHPIFSGITRENLKTWSDYTNWNESKDGFPAIYPVTDGFVLEEKQAVGSTAVLGNYGVGLEGITLAEEFSGKGSVLLCGMDIANRANLDPIADKLLRNMITYTSQTNHNLYPLINAPIIWGKYETEKGVLTGIYSGLMVNATPRVPENMNTSGFKVTKQGHQFAGGQRGGFNTRPGIQYVANGRRPFGPYFLRGFGGIPKTFDEKLSGTGQFWCRIPEGHNMSVSKVWNPSNEPLTITIKINKLEVSKEIKQGETINVRCPVSSSIVNMNFTGDRRLVILQTVFRIEKSEELKKS